MMSYMWSILVLLLIGHGFAGTGDMLVPASQSQMPGHLQELSEEELLEHVKAISLQDAPTDFRAALAEIQSSLGEWGLCLRDVPAAVYTASVQKHALSQGLAPCEAVTRRCMIETSPQKGLYFSSTS